MLRGASTLPGSKGEIYKLLVAQLLKAISSWGHQQQASKQAAHMLCQIFPLVKVFLRRSRHVTKGKQQKFANQLQPHGLQIC
jgi:hypothetical protein